jgi:hypothetical protein
METPTAATWNNKHVGVAAAVMAIAMLMMMTINKDETKEAFTEVAGPGPGPAMSPEAMASTQKMVRTSGPSVKATEAVQNYQGNITMDVASTPEDVLQRGAEYSDAVLAYTNPSNVNLELASNQPSSGLNAPGKCTYYGNTTTGNGFVDYCGELGGNTYPPVDYPGRDVKLSQCAKDLPMFAASSLLPKASPNTDTQELTQEAAQALAALTNLSPIEQFGAPTNFGLPQEVVSSERPAPPIADYLDRPLVAFQQSSYANQRTDGGLNIGDRGGNGLM